MWVYCVKLIKGKLVLQILLMETKQEMMRILQKYESSFLNQLLLALPESCMKGNQQNSYERIAGGIQMLCGQGRVEEGEEFLREIGVEKKAWTKLETFEQKMGALVRQLDKSVEQGMRRVNGTDGARRSVTPGGIRQEGRRQEFQWLRLGSKYPMCGQKLKAKLVQAISDSNNEKRIRERLADPEHIPKVSLLQESLVLDEYEKIRIDYRWTEEDERLLLSNIAALKRKFTGSEFLKRCGRFRFISAHELQTLAAQEISRRLDQSNKVFLSRQFLLDKYYSSKEFLTEQEMRFILKTSPLLSRCVDKQFIRAAIKNIDYQDINKLELSIAENIIARFDQIRKAVRESRKCFKQANNAVIKERIVQFERKRELEVARQMARQQLRKHKLSAPNTQALPPPLQTKKSHLPLNRNHPPSGLFVKDCNQQCTDDLFNGYECNYLERGCQGVMKPKISSSISMMQFYTGGLENRPPTIPQEAVEGICATIKAHHFEKALRHALENFQPIKPSQVSMRSTQKSGRELTRHGTTNDLDRKPKSSFKLADQNSQSTIKRKIMENKQKAKALIYVNKLLALAAENSFAAFRALNAKYTPEQVNTRDQKGNTALFYAAKHQNMQFINHLLALGADPSIPCQKDFTPLHYIFKSNNVNLITRCLCAAKTPNLNALTSEGKTPLAFCTHDVLCRLSLQEGVVAVQNRRASFDNNVLLCRERGLGGQSQMAECLPRQGSRVRLSGQ